MKTDRRTLLRGSCLAAASYALRPAWAAAGIFARPGARRATTSDTVLVVVQLGGGNDGLNSVVPYADPEYARARPRIGLSGSQVLRLDSQTGLHPSLANLHSYMTSGKLAIVQTVGYTGADMSHFRSDDTWEKANLTPETEARGWLGRALDQLYPQDHDAIHAVAGFDTPAFQSNDVTTPTIDGSTAPQGDADQMAALRATFLPAGGANRIFTANVGGVAVAGAEIIQDALNNYSTSIVYPDAGPPLQSVAALIAADVGARVFWVAENGFDTHGNQLGDHESLLQGLDGGLDAFYRDLVAHGQDQRVVVMTYSEFGRRVEDNASGGTDHGTAAPMFILGSKVKGGFYGNPPSLTDLDGDGNLKFSIDFRQVYASMLANWIDTDPVPVLYDRFPTIPFL
jgi:uncharacterized protein (DUF1501 family)